MIYFYVGFIAIVIMRYIQKKVVEPAHVRSLQRIQDQVFVLEEIKSLQAASCKIEKLCETRLTLVCTAASNE